MAATRRKKAETQAAPPPCPAPVTLSLPADINFAAAATLHGELLAARETPEVVLDAGGIERLSTAGVLVLLSFLAARSEMKPPAAVLNPSGAFVDAFSELGLFDKLMRMEFRT